MPQLPIQVWIILAPVLLIGVFSVLLLLVAPMGERPPDEKWNGVFYSNPDDPALLVPKRCGVGYTLNFGNRWAWVVLALILAMVAVPLMLTAMNMRHIADLRRLGK